MKRLFLTIVAMLSLTMTFAENENTTTLNNTEAYDMTVNIDRLGKVLELSKDQMSAVAEIHKTFCAEMLFAAQYPADERDQMVTKAIKKDLAYMDYVLTKEQYRRYLTLLNITLVNPGLR